MKYGVREICDVVLRAKSTQTIGKTEFTKDMPVLYFDSLKTSSLEGASTTVYAQGGRGNARLIAWEGEKTVTFTMEDALISPVGLAVLSGAGLIEGVKDAKGFTGAGTVIAGTTNYGAICHAIETTEIEKIGTTSVAYYASLSHKPIIDTTKMFYAYAIPVDHHGDINGSPVRLEVKSGNEAINGNNDKKYMLKLTGSGLNDSVLKPGKLVMIDYYYESENTKEVTQIDIDAESFAGNYYLEASTLWRNKDGEDLPAEFIIPNCKIQSNFTFSMASSGDPSTFTFTMDAFPDYTKYNKTKKVLCAIRVLQNTQEKTEKQLTDTDVTVHPNGSKTSDGNNEDPLVETDGPSPSMGSYSWKDKLNTEN